MPVITRTGLHEPHPHMAELLSSYQDGLATPYESSLVERHMLECETCRAFYGELQEARAAIAELPPKPNTEIVEQAWERVAQRTFAKKKERRNR